VFGPERAASPEGFDEDADRAGVTDGRRKSGDRRSGHPATKGRRTEAERQAMAHEGVGDSGGRKGRDLHAGRNGVEPTIGPMGGSDHVRIGRAAEMLGVTVDTIRRWADAGRLATTRSSGGQRLVPMAEVTRLIGERRQGATDRPIVAQSARNRFAGIVTRIEQDRVAAVVEILAGPHRLVSLMTAEAVDDMGLKVGDEAVAVVKATNVMVEVPAGGREPRA
jgi:molybdopterin-binding protein